MKTKTLSYEENAVDFLEKTSCQLTISYSRTGKHFSGDKEDRDIYKCELRRGGRKYSFDFGASINDSGFYYTKGRQRIELDRSLLNAKNLGQIIKTKDLGFLNNGKSDVIHYPQAPTEYSVLACLQKYDIGTFDDFVSEFGYEFKTQAQYTSTVKMYEAVKQEFYAIQALFSGKELELLQEIQ